MKKTSYLTPIFAVLVKSMVAIDSSKYFNNEDYPTWLTTNGQNYKSSVFMNTSDDTSGVGLFWSLDKTRESISIAVACPIGNGWCGFGIAEAGAMLGSDMVIFETQNKTFYDAHVLDDINAGPIRDSCQNWKLVSSTVSGDDSDGIIIFETERAWDTGDTFDRMIVDDNDAMVPPTRVIAAWGSSPTVSYHGKNVARSSIRFFREYDGDDEEAFQASMAEVAEGSFELRAKNYLVPETETYYAVTCFTYADLLAQNVPENADLHVIGIEPVVDDDAKEFVHHFVLEASLDPLANYTSPIAEEVCSELPITETAYVWAPGEGSFAFPSNIGGLLGSNGYKSYSLEIHYNNPSLKSGVLDSSGVRIYWTSKKREHDMGIVQLGDPFVALFGNKVGNGLSHHTFECPASCSRSSVSEPITVFREYLHMHKTGTRIYNEQVRDGEVIHSAVIDYFDFNQQGNQPVQQGSFQVLPGDAFRTRCYYKSDDEVWGLGSQDEMCMGFLFYYPRQTVDIGMGVPFPFSCGLGFDFFENCTSTYTNVSMTSSRELDRSFGSSDGMCEEPVDDPGTSSAAAYSSYMMSGSLFGLAALLMLLM